MLPLGDFEATLGPGAAAIYFPAEVQQHLRHAATDAAG